MNNTMTLGELLIFITYMSYFYDPLESMVSNFGVYKALKAGLRRVFAVLHLGSQDIAKNLAKQRPQLSKGNIVFDNVNFSYGDQHILKDVSFEITPGQKVAFIGPSGSGKSTVLKAYRDQFPPRDELTRRVIVILYVEVPSAPTAAVAGGTPGTGFDKTAKFIGAGDFASDGWNSGSWIEWKSE